MKKMLIKIIERYQQTAPFFWSTAGAVIFTSQCRFQPTCSEYCRESIKKYPLPQALIRSLWRLARCQPLARGGYDPA